MGDDVGGIAVHIGARVVSLGGPGEVLVSSTAKDLVVGSGLAFDDRGTQWARDQIPLMSRPDFQPRRLSHGSRC